MVTCQDRTTPQSPVSLVLYAAAQAEIHASHQRRANRLLLRRRAERRAARQPRRDRSDYPVGQAAA